MKVTVNEKERGVRFPAWGTGRPYVLTETDTTSDRGRVAMRTEEGNLVFYDNGSEYLRTVYSIFLGHVYGLPVSSITIEENP